MFNVMALGKRFLNTKLLFRDASIGIGLTFASFLVFKSALQIGFIGDDFWFLTLDVQQIFSMSGRFYRPLGLAFFFLINQSLGDSASIVLHILGIALHAINSYLLFRFAETLTRDMLVSLFTAVVWLFNPNAVEPICWLSALIFYVPLTSLILLTLLLSYNKFKSMCNKPTTQASAYARLGIFIALLWACSLMFHEIALATPLMVGFMFYSGIFFPRPMLKLSIHLLLWSPTLFVTLLYGIIRIALHAPSQLVPFTMGERIGFVIYALWRAFLSTDRVIWHVIHFVENFHPIVALVLVIGSLCATIAILWYFGIYRPVAWGVLATTITVLPSIVFAGTSVGRNLYLPSAMGILTLGIAGSIVLRQIAKVNSWTWTVKDLAKSSLLGIFFAMQVMNLWQATQLMQAWKDASGLVEKLESQMMELTPDLLHGKYSDRELIRIVTVDFPIVINGATSLNSSGVIRTIHRAIPEFETPIQVARVYLNSRQRFETNVEVRDIIDELNSSALVLVFCDKEQAIFPLGFTPVPCLTPEVNDLARDIVRFPARRDR